MGKANSCLRGLVIGFSVLFAVFGCVMVFGTVRATAFGSQLSSFGSSSLSWSWLFSISILAVACLGIYAGFSQKILFLKIFAAFMLVGMIIMLIFGIIAAVTRNEITAAFRDLTPAHIKLLMEDRALVEGLEELQLNTQCCGVLGVDDWSGRIPDSCRCLPAYAGYAAMVGTSSCSLRAAGVSGVKRIYDRPCRDVILIIINILLKTAMAIVFGLAVAMLLCLVASLFMIHQVKRSDGATSIPMKSY